MVYHDIIIAGAGPAGLTAAIYALRAGKSVLILEKGAFGGQMTYSPKIENYPGYASVSGSELADNMVAQAVALGADVEPAEILFAGKDGKNIVTDTDAGKFSCKALIIATGARHRQLGIDGEDELVGRGVSFCALCDGAFYTGKDVVLVGGGNSALQEAILLSECCAHVTVVQNLAYLTGEKVTCEKLLAIGNVSVIYNSVASGFVLNRDGELTALTVTFADGTGRRDIACDGVFVAIGLVPDNKAFSSIVATDERGYIIAGEDTKTSDPAVFAAGDCRTKTVRQVTTACADGAVSAIAACRYIDNAE